MKTIIISSETLEKILWFSAKKNIRPSLSGIYINIDDEGNATLACTDTYRLHEIKWWLVKWKFPEYKGFFDTKTEPIVIDDDWIFCLINNCKQSLAFDKKAHIKLWDWFAYTWIEQEIKLPSTWQFKLRHMVKLNAKYLLEVLKIIPKNTKVQIRNRDPLSAVDLEWEDNWTNTHIIMPLK